MVKYSLLGFQELLPAQVPDALLLELNPAAHTVYSGAGSVSEAVARAKHVHALLPSTRVILRLQGDNDQSGRALAIGAQAAANEWIANHEALKAPGVYSLFLDNESGTNELPTRVAFWTAILDHFGALGQSIAYAAFSTGTPDIPDYPLLVPLFRCAAKWKAAGVPMYFAAHGYFDPSDAGAFYWHLDRPRREAAQVCAAAGIPAPDLVMTEIGVAVGYDAHKMYKDPGGLSGHDYAQRLIGFALPFPQNIFSAGATGGWENANVLDDADFLTELKTQPRIDLGGHPMPIQPTIPPVLGAPVHGAATTALKLRANAGTAYPQIGGIAAQEKLVYYPATEIKNVYPWVFVQKADGTQGWAARADTNGTPWLVPELLPMAWTVRLLVPYVAQQGATANAKLDDCGVACAIEVARYRYVKDGYLDPLNFTVDDWAQKTALVAHDSGLTAAQVAALLQGYGLRAEAHVGLTLDALRAALDAAVPPIVLVNYKYVNPAHTGTLGHFVALLGYNADAFLCHDSYQLGANVTITNAALTQALSDVSTFASTPNQGVLLN